ncbi:MAG: hypothetical protein M0C28_01490 [Candidatus Moduliflexus flocculans]|nr:hypothetical protein [Candidatus Moduliflexus flocculans]
MDRNGATASGPSGTSGQGANNPGDNFFVYKYPNTQEASNIWFHDHTLGATRLNVYAGLAGGYLISDPGPGPARRSHLPTASARRRSFLSSSRTGCSILTASFSSRPIRPPTSSGRPTLTTPIGCRNSSATPSSSTARPWPFKNLEAKRYRFLILNGSNARTYELFLADAVTGANGPPLWVIGTDGGYLDAPVKIDPAAAANSRLVVMPGERYDVVIDFTGFAGRQLIMRNTGRTPYPKGETPQGATLGQIVKFVVGAAPAADSGYDPAAGIPLRPANIVRLANPATGGLGAGVAPSRPGR